MTQRLVLVRHGRSAYVHDGRWLDINGVRRFTAGYDAAGIRDDDSPPSTLIEIAQGADVLVASDLPRAIASIRRLAPNREPVISPLLREIVIDPPTWFPFRMPVGVWDTLDYWHWTYRLMRRADHAAVRRANDAVDWLLAHAADSASTCVVTHGAFRRVLDVRLVARGWRRPRGRRTFANWSAWFYER